jgi:hypothetical protein
MESLCCSTLDLCCRQLTERVPETSKGCPYVGQNKTNKIKDLRKKKLEERNLSCILSEESILLSGSRPAYTYCSKSSSSKTFRFKNIQVFRFSYKKSGGTVHCCIQWESGRRLIWTK